MMRRRSVLVGLAGLGAAGFAPASQGVIDALSEVLRVNARADRLLRGQGLRAGSVAERLARLFADPRFLYPDTEAGRDRAVAGMNARLRALRPRLAVVFGDRPIPAVQVRRMSPADEAAGRGGYREPGRYFVDLHALRTRPAWTLPSVAFHETVPGHALERPDAAPPFSEAWAIYAEQLAADLGAYRRDPLGELGYLHWRLFRLARIVADQGLAQGWTAERAAAEMRAIQGPDIAYSTVASDVERMGRTPGAYAAQGLGALAIAAARPADHRRWPEFHRRVLETNGIP
jgi:uncharacterized protein (DUF885 family)